MNGWMIACCNSRLVMPPSLSFLSLHGQNGKHITALLNNSDKTKSRFHHLRMSPSLFSSLCSRTVSPVSLKNPLTTRRIPNTTKANGFLAHNRRKVSISSTRRHRVEHQRTNQRLSSSSSSPNSVVNDQPEFLVNKLVEVSERPGGIDIWIKQQLNDTQRLELAALISKATVSSQPYVIPEPSRHDLKLVVFTTSIPFVGFGIMDNSILIIAGDAIDTSLGVTFGISTMCAAAIGNIISDIAGIGLGTVVEDFCAMYLRLPVPNITTAQRQLRSVRYANQLGCGIGIVIGCIIGMFPLLWIDSNKVQVKKREAQMDSIFKDIVTQAKTLIGASRVCLYLRVNDKNNPVPVSDGKYLYIKYDNASAHYTNTTNTRQERGEPNVNKTEAQNSNASSSTDMAVKKQERFIPVGRGIVSRALLTGETWNIVDAQSEPDFAPDLGYVDWDDAHNNAGKKTKTMICVPIFDIQGTPIAVIQAVNKIATKNNIGTKEAQNSNVKSTNDPNNDQSSSNVSRFTESDVQIIKALASHISVSLQRMYDNGRADEEVRLQDTIRMLKEYGLAGINPEDGSIGGDDQVKRSSKNYSIPPLLPEK